MKFKKVLLLLIVTLLFVGLSYATEVSDDNTTSHTSSEADTYTANSIEEVAHTSNTPVKEVENTSTDEKDTDKQITKQYNNNVKTARKTYTVNDYNTLHNALTNSKYSILTLNINSNITLSGNTELNKAIKTLTINGNGYTINGNNKYQFLKINAGSTVTIKSLTIINCYKEDYGGAIDNSGKLIISNCILNNNIAESGGAIRNMGILTIAKTDLYNNKAEYHWGDTLNNGGAIRNDGKLSISNSSLCNNNAYYGGAIYNNGTLTIINSTLYDNYAKSIGGAIFNRKKLVINNSRIKNNRADAYDEEESYYGDKRLIDNIFNYRITTKITINKIANTQYTETTTIKGTFKSISGKVLPAKLTININGKNYITKSDVNGTFTFKYKTNAVGTNNVTVTYAGNTKYKSASSL